MHRLNSRENPPARRGDLPTCKARKKVEERTLEKNASGGIAGLCPAPTSFFEKKLGKKLSNNNLWVKALLHWLSYCQSSRRSRHHILLRSRTLRLCMLWRGLSKAPTPTEFVVSVRLSANEKFSQTPNLIKKVHKLKSVHCTPRCNPNP